jgi:hypothetical protein
MVIAARASSAGGGGFEIEVGDEDGWVEDE